MSVDWISEAAPLKPHVLTTLIPAADILWNVSEMSLSVFRVDNQYAFDPTNWNSLELIKITNEANGPLRPYTKIIPSIHVKFTPRSGHKVRTFSALDRASGVPR